MNRPKPGNIPGFSLGDKTMKKEKYILVQKNAAGNIVIRIQIQAYGQTYRQTLNLKKFESEKEALTVARSIRDKKLVEMASGYTVSNFKTVKEIYDKTFELLPVRQKTRERHKHFYNVGISKYGSMTIDKITSADIQTSINKYAETHTREQTGHLLAVWRRIYKTAVMMNISIPDRTQAVIIPECREDRPRKKEISSKDLEAFLEEVLEYNNADIKGSYQGKAIYYAVQIMRYTGIRPAECFALMKDDIYLNGSGNGFISINKAAHSTIDNHLELGKTKTIKSVRTVPVSPVLSEILKECLAWSKHDLLLADYYGNIQDIDIVSDYVRRVSKKAGVQFNLYMLRHQFSTDLVAGGVNLAVIRDLLGHENVDMSLYYAVSREEDRREAIEKRKFN